VWLKISTCSLQPHPCDGFGAAVDHTFQVVRNVQQSRTLLAILIDPQPFFASQTDPPVSSLLLLWHCTRNVTPMEERGNTVLESQPREIGSFKILRETIKLTSLVEAKIFGFRSRTRGFCSAEMSSAFSAAVDIQHKKKNVLKEQVQYDDSE